MINYSFMDKKKYILFTIVLFIFAAIIALMVSPHNSQDLGGGFWYDIEGKRVFGPDIDVPPVAKVMQCKGDYIIVEQHPNKQKEEATYEREYIYPCGRDTTYYWVINNKEHFYWGPLLQSELDSILIEYSIKL